MAERVLTARVAQIPNALTIARFAAIPVFIVLELDADGGKSWPAAIVFADGNTDHMVANCDVLVTRYSTVALVAAALGKQVDCDLAPETLRALAPLQTGGDSARRIAAHCREVLAA